MYTSSFVGSSTPSEQAHSPDLRDGTATGMLCKTKHPVPKWLSKCWTCSRGHSLHLRMTFKFASSVRLSLDQATHLYQSMAL